jgi:hypothetical protein
VSVATHPARSAAPVLLAGLLLLSACGSNRPVGGKASQVKLLPASLLPATLAGLAVHAEDVQASLKTSSRTYADGIALFSLRKDGLIQATMQVTHLRTDARLGDSGFERGVAQLVGSGSGTPIRVGERQVYGSTANTGSQNVWFAGRYLFVLTIRKTYVKPREVIEAATAVSL